MGLIYVTRSSLHLSIYLKEIDVSDLFSFEKQLFLSEKVFL